MFRSFFLILKTSNNNPDLATVMQEKGCSGFVKPAMDVVSISFLV